MHDLIGMKVLQPLHELPRVRPYHLAEMQKTSLALLPNVLVVHASLLVVQEQELKEHRTLFEELKKGPGRGARDKPSASNEHSASKVQAYW